MKQPLFSNVAAISRRPIRPMTWAMSASTLALACSFGSVGDGETGESPLPPDAVRQTPDPDADPEDSMAPDDGVGPKPTDGEPAPPPYDPDADPFSTLLGQQARNILETSCGSCHTGIGAKGDFGYLLDVQRLIAGRKLVPGQKNES